MVQFCDEWYLYIILSFYLLGSLATEQDLAILAFKLYGIEDTVIAISVGVSFTNLYCFICFISLHSCFLLFSGSGATILRAGLIELPDEIDEECATGGVADGQLSDAVDGGIGLVGVEDVVATHIERQRAETTEVEVALHAEREVETLGVDAEVVVVALRCPLGIGRQTKTMRQFDVVVPDERDVWVVEGLDGTVGRRRLVVLEYGEDIPHRVPFADGGACGETQ